MGHYPDISAVGSSAAPSAPPPPPPAGAQPLAQQLQGLALNAPPPPTSSMAPAPSGNPFADHQPIAPSPYAPAANGAANTTTNTFANAAYPPAPPPAPNPVATADGWPLPPPLPPRPRFARTGGLLGPFLRFNDLDPATAGAHRVSVLVVAEPSLSPATVQLHYSVNGPPATPAPGRVVDVVLGYTFWRFDVALPLPPSPAVVHYCVGLVGAAAPLAAASYHLPARGESWRWLAHSCSGFHDRDVERRYGGVTHLWRDALARHTSGAARYHLQVGGGDQLYCDSVLELPSLQPWLSIADAGARAAAEFTPAMLAQVEHYYLGRYAECFGDASFAAALAAIPSVFTWDDHDIFDGWGSYPAQLQASPVFQGLFSVARRFFLLFQQHCTFRDAALASATFSGGGPGAPLAFHQVRSLGADALLLAPDCRSERSIHVVVTHDSWDALFAEAERRLVAGGGAVRHVVVLLTVPIVYPTIPLAHKTMSGVSSLMSASKFVRNTLSSLAGSVSGALSPFEDVELLDDMRDHWTSAEHAAERAALVRRLQALATRFGVRVTFLSGDVHLGAFGCFQGQPKQFNRCADAKFMLQVVSSAIGNEPPPAGVVATLEAASVATTNLGDDVMDKMIRAFPHRKKLRAARNYCEVLPLTQPVVDPITNLMMPPGGLAFTLHFEAGPPGAPLGMEAFTQVAPPLLAPEQVAAQRPCAAAAASASFSASASASYGGGASGSSGGAYAPPAGAPQGGGGSSGGGAAGRVLDKVTGLLPDDAREKAKQAQRKLANFIARV